MAVGIRLCLITAILCLNSVQYGYNMAELNAPEKVYTCRAGNVPKGPGRCIRMSPFYIGLVTALFNAGGFVGSSIAGKQADKFGRIRTALFSTIGYIIGPLIMFASTSVGWFGLGRFITGLSAGAAVVVVPMYINEVAPSEHAGRLGSMNQLAINIGIITSQIVGVFLSTPKRWRIILLVAPALAILTAVLLIFVPESPAWLKAKGYNNRIDKSLQSIYGHNWQKHRQEIIHEASTLVAEQQESKSVNLSAFIRDPKYHRPLIAILDVSIAQQLSGINAVVLYGVSILSVAFPQSSAVINCFITAVNCIVTFMTSLVVDKVPRKTLLLTSLWGMAISAAVLSLSLTNTNLSWLSVVSVIAFTFFFASGIGPLPFLLIPELTPKEATGIGQSIGMASNWTFCFLVALLFPLLNQHLGHDVFYLFTGFSVYFALLTAYKVPETKDRRSMSAVWGPQSIESTDERSN